VWPVSFRAVSEKREQLECELGILHGLLEEENRRAQPKARRRRKPTTRKITERQAAALAVFAQCQGNTKEAASRLGITRQGADKLIKSALVKAGYSAAKYLSLRPQTQALPVDRRGQSVTADGEDRRRK